MLCFCVLAILLNFKCQFYFLKLYTNFRFIHGFDGGMKNCITLSTEFGEYNLMRPSVQYTPLMNNLYEKIWISKVVVEYLEEYHYLQPTYEDLLVIVRDATIPELDDMKMTEEMLHKHAQFVCDQVVSLEAQDEDDEPLITLPCMRELIKLMGIKFGRRKSRTKIQYKKVDKQAWTKATTTPLVRKTFESFFSNQLDKTNKVGNYISRNSGFSTQHFFL